MRKYAPLLLARVAAAFSLGLASLPLQAGDIVGTVTDSANSGLLSGAKLTIVQTGRTTVTDRGGNFQFFGLPEGDYSLKIAYLGYEDKTLDVAVPASGSVPVAVKMGDDVVQLERFVVEGYREGRARALQQKQNQANISDIIASDAIGNLPDRNVAEAVGRLPGVSLSLEQGEGRYISIRGVEPNLNQVLLDGATMAAPGGTRLGRATPLDTLGASQISQIEVIKSVTPDLDANSLGGTLNIKTASAFDRKGRFIAGGVTGNYNETSEKYNLEAQLNYSNIFGKSGHWGLAASINYDKRFYENHWVQASWSLLTVDGVGRYLPNDFQVKPEVGNTARHGASFNLEYRPNDTLRVYLRPNYSFSSNYENRFETNVSVDNSLQYVTFATPTSGTYAGSRARTERRELRRLYEQDLFTLAGGFEKKLGDVKIEGMLTHSSATEDRVYDKSREFRNATGDTGPVTFDFTTFDFNRWSVDSAIDTPAKYPLRRTRDDYGLVDEGTSTAKLDVRWDSDSLLGSHSGFLKAGMKYLQRSRITDLESRRVEPTTSWRLDAVGTLPGVSVYNERFNSGFLLDWTKIDAFIAANPALVRPITLEEAQNSIEDDYDIDEFIYSGYTMGSITIKKFTVLGGVRWEKTDATIRAVEVRTFGKTLLGRFPTSGSTSYDKFFPNLQGVYRFNERLLARAAITQTIGRPAYEDSRPLANFRYSSLGNSALDPVNFGYSGTLDIGNPDLGPFESRNYDLSLEWYLKGAGIVSIAAFRKEIDNPIYLYSETQRNVVHSGIGLETLGLSSRRNADSGEISGIEASLYLPFSFLPAPFDGFGLDANLTRISSNVKIPTRAGADFPFFRQPGELSNMTFFYERNGFSGRLAYSYADGQLYSIGASTYNDIYRLPRKQLDLQFRYRLSEHYSISASVRNLTREPEQFRYGIEGLLRTSRLLDRDYKISLNFNY
jgi:TonB-dependent receptor